MTAWLRSVYYDGLLYLANRVVAHIPSHLIRLFFYRRVMGFSVGRSSYIFMGAWFDNKGEGSFVMGDHSVINQKCRLDNRGAITIGNNVGISADVIILTADHDLQSQTFAGRSRRVSIGDHAFIGTRAMLMPGVNVGRGAAVGAGAIVTRDVAPFTIVAGCPAKPIGRREVSSFDYKIDYGRLFH